MVAATSHVLVSDTHNAKLTQPAFTLSDRQRAEKRKKKQRIKPRIPMKTKCAIKTIIATAFAIAACLTVNHASADLVAGWDVSTLIGGNNNFGPSPLAATVANPNLTIGGLTRGSGVGTIGTGAARGWGGNDWTNLTSN